MTLCFSQLEHTYFRRRGRDHILAMSMRESITLLNPRGCSFSSFLCSSNQKDTVRVVVLALFSFAMHKSLARITAPPSFASPLTSRSRVNIFDNRRDKTPRTKSPTKLAVHSKWTVPPGTDRQLPSLDISEQIVSSLPAETAGQAPASRCRHACCAASQRLFIFGGKANASLLDDLTELNTGLIDLVVTNSSHLICVR